MGCFLSQFLCCFALSIFDICLWRNWLNTSRCPTGQTIRINESKCTHIDQHYIWVDKPVTAPSLNRFRQRRHETIIYHSFYCKWSQLIVLISYGIFEILTVASSSFVASSIAIIATNSIGPRSTALHYFRLVAVLHYGLC